MESAARSLAKLGKEEQRRILKFARERLEGEENPRRTGKPMQGNYAVLLRIDLIKNPAVGEMFFLRGSPATGDLLDGQQFQRRETGAVFLQDRLRTGAEIVLGN